ncbi:MAG: helix-turn-helix domain-containing protein [Balneolaceae bacterium]|nr:helix-turn-helix domain-containing protein [Balneolaceae bacterium]
MPIPLINPIIDGKEPRQFCHEIRAFCLIRAVKSCLALLHTLNSKSKAMNYNRLENSELQFVAERKELELYFNKVLRNILREELPLLLEKLGKKDWLTKEELMEFTGWSSRTIQHMRDTNQIPYSQHGRKILYPRIGIEEFLENHYISHRRDKR